MRLLELNIFRQANLLILSTQEQDGLGGRSDIFDEQVPFNAAKIDALAQGLLQRLNFQFAPKDNRERLEAQGQRLFDLLLGPNTHQKLRTSQADHLRLVLPEDLLSLPWELLHDGQQFLCLKYAMGRIVRRSRSGTDSPRREHALPYRMLILCDPREDLPHASHEGQSLRNTFKSVRNKVRVELQSGPIRHQEVLEQVRRNALLHYAGHAIGSAPGQDAAWLLEDASLTAEDLRPMQGSPLVPAFIFANACQSATAHAEGPPSLAATFLQVGVRHYLGTISELPDQTSETVALDFYAALLNGLSVGQALRQARKAMANALQLPSMAWAGYVLYGEPEETYFPIPSSVDEPTPFNPFQRSHPESRREPAQHLPEIPVQPKPAPVDPQPDPARPPVIQPPTTPATAGTEPASRPRLKDSLWTGVLVTLTLLGGLSLGLLAASGIFGPLELIWESAQTLMLPRGEAAPQFSTPLLLLGIEQDEREQARGLYARLLEGLVRSGRSPAIVAIDTWLKTERRTPDDERLMRAVASAIKGFPVMLALERDPHTRALLPPPPWFLEGVQKTLLSLNEGECQARLLSMAPPLPATQDPQTGAPSTAPVSISDDAVKACTLQHTQTDMTARLVWSDISMQRPPWVLEYFGLRVPLLHELAGRPGVLQLDEPHFVLRLAQPTAPLLDPGKKQLWPGEQDSLARYDQRGMIPVVYTGRASWTGGPSFPAVQLRTLLDAWDHHTPLPPPIQQALDLLSSPGRLRLLVGTASEKTRGNEMDRYNSPVGWMFGVEVLANASEALATGKVPRPTPAPLWPVLGAGSAMAGLSLSRHRRRGSALLALGLAMTGASYGLLALGWSVPPIAPLLALALGGVLGRWLPHRNPVPLRLGVVVLTLALLSSPAMAQTAKGASGSGARPAATPSASPASAPTSTPASAPTSAPASPERPAGTPTSSSGSASGQAARLPQPQAPVPLVVEQRAIGWRILWLRPADKAFAARLLAQNSRVLDISGPLPGGTVLTSDRDDARLAIEFYGGPLGILVQHELSGKFDVTLEAAGQITLRDGSVWTRLYRYLAEASGKLFMDYEGTPAGFGSTEVVYEHAGHGLFSQPTLSVIEGKVTLPKGAGAKTLKAGETQSLGGLFSWPRPSDPDTMKQWVARGSEVMAAGLSSPGTCPAREKGLANASLVSRVCYADTQARNIDFASARNAIAQGGNAAAWQKLGNVWLAAGDYDQAADCYRRSAQVGNDAEVVGAAWLEFGNSQWLAGRAEEALNGYKKAITMDVGQAVAWNNLGVLSWSEGNLWDAREALRKAVKLDPGFYQGWRNLGRVLVKDSPQDAVLAWQRAGQIDPYDRALWSDLAATYEAMGRKEQALQASEKRLKLDLDESPEEPMLQQALEKLILQYEDLSKDYDASGKQREALQLLDRAMELRKRLKQ